MIDEVECENMMHWLEQYPNQDIIMQFSVDKVRNSTKKWMSKLKESGSNVIEQDSDVKLIKDLEDGYYLVKLVTEASYKYEGSQMSHCVGSYHSKKCDIYSVRDKYNKPHCTIEVSNGRATQIKGKQNRFVVSKYVPYVLKSLEHLKASIDSPDLANLGLIEVDSKTLKILTDIAGEPIPTCKIKDREYINNSDSYWHE